MEADFLNLIKTTKEQVLSLDLISRDIEERVLESLKTKPIKIISGFRRQVNLLWLIIYYLLYLQKTFAIDELLKFDWGSKKIFSKLKK